MSTASPALPPFGVVAAALRRTTEHLARELAMPGTARPDWNEFEWDVARAVAVMQGITVLLAHQLQWRGPRSWQQFLDTQHRQALQREMRIDALIVRVDAALQDADACVVGLKGTALRALGLYRPGERPMGDIDLLTRPEDRGRIDRALRSLDYVEAFATRRHIVYEPREKPTAAAHGEDPRNPLKIEIHECIGEPLPVRCVDITHTLYPGDMRPGINPYRNDAGLMRHLLLHAAGNMRAHALRQVQLNDIALLGRRLGAEAWDKLLCSRDSEGGSWWMYPPLALTARYYPDSACPALAEFAAACPPVLRLAAGRETLTRVSWSNLRIHAFPGLSWSRSPLDVLRFMRQRILPGRTALTELDFVEVAQPALKAVPWYGLGHSQRIVRWMVSRPPRAQTIMSLHAALEAGSPRDQP
ncbi:MAG TPA: nucleotidyltransferase family protein [Steroidobacteraceae bacterium]|nr:nucleotidyltransferase family protein [Steroidobacteraceae bacterium]